MTSTSFSVGLVDSRNSSRVLRPPGGGHTDIFGISDQDKGKKPVQTEFPQSERKEETKTEEHEHESPEKQKQPGESSSPKKDILSSKEAEERKPEQEPTVIPPQRKRIPPGGYSSGLW